MRIKCLCCTEYMRNGLDAWHWYCQSCRYESAQFGLTINETSSHALVDELGRENGLKSLRDRNFRELLQLILRYLPPGSHKLLDVGAAHGWFVKMAAERMDALGIEPDHIVCQKAKAQGIPLIEGYFPDVLADDARFDVIVFNDVIEHLPHIENTLEACKKHLANNALLVLNLPCSNGFFYKTSKLLKQMGFGSAFERMWQKGFPSPHLHYFNSENLVKVVERNGFETVCNASLPTLCLDGLYDRITHVKGSGKAENILSFIATALIIPFMPFLKSDIAVVIFRKNTT